MGMHRARTSIRPPDTALIAELESPDAFPGETTGVELVETHISWVLLTDSYAYKIKKPVDLGFLDFSTLARRRYFCEEEIRLNSRWAPELYVDVQPVVRSGDRLRVGGAGEAVEYAVRMHRFEEAMRLDHQLENDELTARDMAHLGEVIADRHEAADRVPAARRNDYLRQTRRFIEDNFRMLAGRTDEKRLARLRRWSQHALDGLTRVLLQRFDAGFVRDCHGDLHLGNLVRLPGGITPFDCIEFDPALRETDVICDVAFLAMDLVARGRRDLGSLFLNRYLECTGDYEGLAVLDLFFVYRSLVRAKVAAIEAEEHEPGPPRDEAEAELDRYVSLACRQTDKPGPLLLLMHGLSGSGKTWLSSGLMAALPAIRIRSDLERKRLFGLDELADSASGVAAGIYTPEASEAVYRRLTELAVMALGHGHNLILDAAFLSGAERRRAMAAAAACGSAVVIVHADTAPAVLRERLKQRAAEAGDASEADTGVLDHQLASARPLTAEERRRTVDVDTTKQEPIETLLARIRAVSQENGGS